jgi:NAD(P)-dependent dehydrogenase (short-subunit alcohol dehydrogenase family)
MSGTTTLITGGNAGIGRATAEELVRRGSDVVIACRNQVTAEETALALRQLDPYFDTLGTIEVADVDLASLKSVRSLISTLSSRKKPFDCIIASAGVMTPPVRIETEDGFEKQFQVNYLSQFLLIHDLLKNLMHKYERTGQKPPRCVFLSSMTHVGAALEKDLDNDLQGKISYNPFTCYANSKLCQLLVAKEFDRRMNDNSGEFPAGAAVACHPGIVNTALARQYFKDQVPKVLLPLASPFLDKLFFPVFLKTPKAAAESVLFAATAPADEVGGKYVQECAVARSSEASNDVVLASRLWKKSKELAGLE